MKAYMEAKIMHLSQASLLRPLVNTVQAWTQGNPLFCWWENRMKKVLTKLNMSFSSEGCMGKEEKNILLQNLKFKI
jgi:hypothetical protein